MEKMAPRPYVKIDALNQVDMLRQHLDSILPQLKGLAGIVGLTLNGGLSRGYADHLSEIDITVYLNPETFVAWQNSKTPIPVGITKLGGVLYDIKLVDFEAEKTRFWDSVDRWDASYAEILHDPYQKLNQLIEEKIAGGPSLDEAGGLLFSCWWYYRLTGDIWIYRGDALQGHHMLNQAVTALLGALFVANQEFIPHEKWLVHMSRSLNWTPPDWERRLGVAMSAGALTIKSLRERQAAIEELWTEIDGYIVEVYYPHLPVRVMQKSVYDQLIILSERGAMALSEWKSTTGSGAPNGDPFFDIVTIENDRIVLEREKLLNSRPEDMYSWHYEILKAVSTGVSQ